MYLLRMYQCEEKIEDKTKSLFRPWDNEKTMQKKLDTNQDSTVSTTTEFIKESVSAKCSNVKTKNNETKHKISHQLESSDKSRHKCNTTEPVSFRPHIKPDLYHTDRLPIITTDCAIPMANDCCSLGPESYSLYPEAIQANLAHTLGLTQNDPLFLESLAQGYALEEYARILSQEQQAKLNNKKQRPKKYKCPHCDVGFSNNGQLKGHIRIHTGERPFKCDEKDCGKTFTRNEELTRHKRIHSGLRPYPCSQCGKRFGRKDHLKKHSRTHFQPKGLYAVPVMLPFETWAASSSAYPYLPMYGY